MKQFRLKTIVVSVIVALACVFAYQAYWLVGLYRSEAAGIDKKVREVMEESDYGEMDVRMRMMKADQNNKHGSIVLSASFNNESETAKTTSTTEYADHPTLNRYVSKKHPLVMEDKGNDDESVTSMMTTHLVPMLQRTLHESLNELSKPNISVYDSLLVSGLRRNGIEPPYRLLLRAKGKAVGERGTEGYQPGSGSKTYTLLLYGRSGKDGMLYELTIEPQTKAVLRQMAGILCTSATIMAVLAVAFWYLIYIMMRQKTLDEMKSDFTNNITHELKTPIAVAFAANDALLNYGFLNDPKKSREYIGISQEQLQRLREMVEQILSMSMERRKAMRLDMQDVRVKDAVDALVAQHRLKADKQVAFSVDIKPVGLTVKADPMHFTNIVSNLIDNSVKYSKNQVSISLKACREDGAVVFAVTDNGIGIPKSKQKYIFDRFYRVADGNRYTVKGYGLGLFYVKSLMEKMGGTAAVRSEQGRGTTIILRFNG